MKTHYLLRTSWQRALLAGSVASALAVTGCNDSDQADVSDGSDTVDVVPSVGAANANKWYDEGEKLLAQNIDLVDKTQTAKNIVLIVGDGMGISTLTAGRILVGQQQTDSEGGEEYALSFERFPHVALSKTYNTDSQTPDSAGTMTAMMTGVKTFRGGINIGSSVNYGDCTASQQDELVSALDLAKMAGMSAGIVATARVTHATPAATYARTPARGWEADYYIKRDAQDGLGCTDIADQLVNYDVGGGLDVVLGGGRRNFLDYTQSEGYGYRDDGRNLITEWQAKDAGNVYVEDRQALAGIDVNDTGRLMGLFSRSHMSYEAQRDTNEEPSLAEMTESALNVLSKNEKGFFLMIEAGRIDHAHHGTKAGLALHDTQALHQAVERVVEMTNPEETLIIVTADHSHVMTMGGYAERGNDILGLVRNSGGELQLALDGKPYTTLLYGNGPSARDNQSYDANGDRVALYDEGLMVDSKNQALVPLSSETHAGEDVAIYATGPGAHFVRGTLEQNMIFHIMNQAGDLINRAEEGVAEAGSGS
ncbi:alkaline phosphatase [Photobacterium japonica]|uniref:alkaline phosphatase n=1 Tax=Photobacterium japonica TaxID=2910235 RepID=UPI003D0CFCE9